MRLSGFRMLPPSAAPLYPRDILAGLGALGSPHEAEESLREAVRNRFGVRHVFLVTSGRAGLSAGLGALRRLAPHRDEVVLPAFTSFSVPSAVVNAGLKVRLYDLQPETLAPDMESLEHALGPKTLCVIVCHLFGYPVNLADIEALCRLQGASLFDDAAQAMGACVDGRLAGTMGDVGLFSLSRGKNVTAVEGGIVLTDREDVARHLHAVLLPEKPASSAWFRYFLYSLALQVMLHPLAYWLPASLPFLNIGASVFDPVFELKPLDAFRAVLADGAMKRMDALNSDRQRVACSLERKLLSVKGLRAVRPLPGATPVFLRLPVLPESGAWPGGCVPVEPALGIVRSYPKALHELRGLVPHLVSPRRFRAAEMLAREMVTLPTHAFVRAGDACAVAEFFLRQFGWQGPSGQEAAA